MEIVFATGNQHKLQEINEITGSFFVERLGDLQLKTPHNDFGQKYTVQSSEGLNSNSIEFILPPDGFNPVENGCTFEENSLIKAKEAARLSGKISLADDSGLCVEALNGAPGLYSSRYAGTQQEKIDKILKELEPFENRKAKFVCVMTLVNEKGEVLHISKGECCGNIAKSASGKNGFGYDPVFEVENTGLTMAEMKEDEKNRVSHRGRALRDMICYIVANKV